MPTRHFTVPAMEAEIKALLHMDDKPTGELYAFLDKIDVYTTWAFCKHDMWRKRVTVTPIQDYEFWARVESDMTDAEWRDTNYAHPVPNTHGWKYQDYILHFAARIMTRAVEDGRLIRNVAFHGLSRYRINDESVPSELWHLWRLSYAIFKLLDRRSTAEYQMERQD